MSSICDSYWSKDYHDDIESRVLSETQFVAPPFHIYKEKQKGHLDRVTAGEAPQTALRKLPGSGWTKLEVGVGAHQSADHPGRPTSGSHPWPPPLARKLPGGSLQPCHLPELLTRWISYSGAPFDPFWWHMSPSDLLKSCTLDHDLPSSSKSSLNPHAYNLKLALVEFDNK